MDDLEFRRRLIAAPYEEDEELLEALEQSPKAQKLQADMQELNDQIAQALKVEVPEGLTEQLILRQRFHQHKEKQQKFKWAFAMAASVMLVITATFTLWPQPHSNLADYALAHVYHEPAALESIDESVGLQQVNVKLASYGVQATGELGHVYYSNHCDFKGKRSLHMVVEHQGEKFSIFVVPELNDFDKAPSEFSDKRYQGAVTSHQNTGLIVIGESKSQVKSLNEQLSKSFDWGPI